MGLALPAVTIKAALAGLEALGLSPDTLLQVSGLDSAPLDEPFAVVPDGAFARLWAAAFAQRPEPTLTVRAALATPMGAFGILDHLVGAAHTVGEAMQTLALFFRLVSATITLDLRHSGGDSVWIINTPKAPTDHISDAWTLTLLIQRFRSIADDFAVQQICLAQPAGPADEAYAALLNAPILFDQPRSGLLLAPGVWRAPLQSANPALYTTLREIAARADVKTFSADPLQYVLRTYLDAALQDGRFSAVDVAAHLGISLRTLQRRLADEQISFQHLLDAHRQERALHLLRTGGLNMAEIAYELGYSEQSAFNRAFKRWTGLSPRAWSATNR